MAAADPDLCLGEPQYNGARPKQGDQYAKVVKSRATCKGSKGSIAEPDVPYTGATRGNVRGVTECFVNIMTWC